MASDVVGPWEMPFTGLPRRMAPSDLCRSTQSKRLTELDRTLGIGAFKNAWYQETVCKVRHEESKKQRSSSELALG